MLLTEGTWSGRGRFLFHGQSLGTAMRAKFLVSSDDHGLHIEGDLDIDQRAVQPCAIRILADDTGMFEMTVDGLGAQLEGTAKLSSEPNMGLLWSELKDVHASFALFATAEGCGCRGFARDAKGLTTWELALVFDAAVARRRRTGSGVKGRAGSNVVRLPKRR